jgi:hypothetical protein
MQCGERRWLIRGNKEMELDKSVLENSLPKEGHFRETILSLDLTSSSGTWEDPWLTPVLFTVLILQHHWH